MSWFSVVVVFVLIWWVIFFMALPIGLNRQSTDKKIGSPERPLLVKKAIWVSVITAALTLGLWYATESGTLNLRPLLDQTFAE